MKWFGRPSFLPWVVWWVTHEDCSISSDSMVSVAPSYSGRVFYLHRQSDIVRQNICMSELNDANRTKCPGWKIFPYCFEIDSETALQCNSISHSVIYILGGPTASLSHKYMIMSENMYSWFSITCTGWLYQYNNILSSISLPELLCTYNVATD